MRDPKQGPGNQRKGKNRFEPWQMGGWILVIGVAVAALLILPGLWFGSSPVAHVSYSQALTQIEKANVRSCINKLLAAVAQGPVLLDFRQIAPAPPAFVVVGF